MRLYKILLVGDSGVGKSSFLLRYCNGTFEDDYAATIGVDFRVKVVVRDHEMVKLQLWDTAGQEKFRCLIKHYYRGVHSVLLFYDVSCVHSFIHLPQWILDIRAEAGDVPIVLIGTKIDTDRLISTEQGLKFATKNNLGFFETSAKTQDVEGILAHVLQTMPPPSTLPPLNVEQPEKAKGCCS